MLLLSCPWSDPSGLESGGRQPSSAVSPEQTAEAKAQSYDLIASRERPIVRILDLLFWACVAISLVLSTLGFIAHHAFGWGAYLMAGIDYWFYFSVLLGPVLFLTRRPGARFLLALPGSRTWKLLVSMLLFCGLEELMCFLTGTGLWEPRPRAALFPAWFFGTGALVAWGAFTVLLMHLLKLHRKEALYIGGLAGWVQEAFLFQPRFFAAPVLLTVIAPLIAFTYMQLIIWPLEMYADRPRVAHPPVKMGLRFLGALIGILILEEVTAAALYFTLVRR
jgi:hypothetical protein